MQKLMLGMVMLVVFLLAACTPDTTTPPVSEAPTQETVEAEETKEESNDQTETEEEKDKPFSFYGENCNPYFFDCIGWWYGTCEWSYWHELYICEDYMFYDPPGYECEYDWWLGYVCRPTYEIDSLW